MRILFLSSHLPLSGKSGGRQREFEILSRLAKIHTFYGVVVSKSYEEDRESSRKAATLFEKLDIFASPEFPSSHGLQGPSQEPHQVRRNRSVEASERVRALLSNQTFDIVHCEGYYMSPLVPREAPPLVLIEQNIEYRLELQRARLTGHLKHRIEAVRILACQREAWNRAAACGFLTREDRKCAERVEPGMIAHLTPNGRPARIEMIADGVARRGGSTILLPGNFGYAPTEDAAFHFLRVIAPLIRDAVPNVKIVLAGALPSTRLKRLARSGNVTITGWVEDLTPSFRDADLVVCPLRVGGGIKMKMLDAISHGKAIVTTPVGAQGLRHLGDAFVITKGDTAFARACVDLLQSPDRRRNLEAHCQAAWYALPTWEQAAQAVSRLYSAVTVSQRYREISARPD
jgi:polysaccharide biosynthesis protein PslH